MGDTVETRKEASEKGNGNQKDRYAVLEKLARRFPQLYLTPAEGMSKTPLYRSIVRQGQEYAGILEDHFLGSERDSYELVETPAGEAEAVFLAERKDFECFYRIMGYRCENADIPATCGAGAISGINDWSKIRNHKMEYLLSGGTDWQEEFAGFTKDKKNYTSSVIILSEGPYSALPAEEAGRPEEEWLRISLTIRKYHELTHFVCRKKFPELQDAVYDEVLADAIGIIRAEGSYDAKLARLFLFDSGKHSGRLKNYVSPEELPAAEKKAEALIRFFETETRECPADIFATMLRLEPLGKACFDGLR